MQSNLGRRIGIRWSGEEELTGRRGVVTRDVADGGGGGGSVVDGDGATVLPRTNGGDGGVRLVAAVSMACSETSLRLRSSVIPRRSSNRRRWSPFAEELLALEGERPN